MAIGATVISRISGLGILASTRDRIQALGDALAPIATFLFYGLIPVIFIVLSQIAPASLPSITNSYVWFLGSTVLSTSGHVFFTWAPFAQRDRSAPLGVSARYFWPATALVVSLTLALTSKALLVHLMAYATIFHVIRQQIGILVKTCRLDLPAQDIRIHTGVAWVVTLFPILYWHSYASTTALQYFSPNDLFRVFPGEPFSTLKQIVPFVFFAYLISLLRYPLIGLKFPIRIFVMQVGTFIWYYCGIIYYSETSLFWILTAILHGHVYIYYVVRDQNKVHLALNERSPWLHLYYLMPLLLVLTIWEFAKPNLSYVVLSEGLTARVLMAILWTPAILHYTLDALIWRSKQDKMQKAPISDLPVFKKWKLSPAYLARILFKNSDDRSNARS